jgi:hypothetical protein
MLNAQTRDDLKGTMAPAAALTRAINDLCITVGPATSAQTAIHPLAMFVTEAVDLMTNTATSLSLAGSSAS